MNEYIRIENNFERLINCCALARAEAHEPREIELALSQSRECQGIIFSATLKLLDDIRVYMEATGR